MYATTRPDCLSNLQELYPDEPWISSGICLGLSIVYVKAILNDTVCDFKLHLSCLSQTRTKEIGFFLKTAATLRASKYDGKKFSPNIQQQYKTLEFIDQALAYHRSNELNDYLNSRNIIIDPSVFQIGGESHFLSKYYSQTIFGNKKYYKKILIDFITALRRARANKYDFAVLLSSKTHSIGLSVGIQAGSSEPTYSIFDQNIIFPGNLDIDSLVESIFIAFVSRKNPHHPDGKLMLALDVFTLQEKAQKKNVSMFYNFHPLIEIFFSFRSNLREGISTNKLTLQTMEALDKIISKYHLSTRNFPQRSELNRPLQNEMVSLIVRLASGFKQSSIKGNNVSINSFVNMVAQYSCLSDSLTDDELIVSLSSVDVNGMIWVEFCMEYGNLSEIEKLICANANVNQTDDEGYSFLMKACSKQNGLIVDRLIKSGASIHCTTPKGNNVFREVCRKGFLLIMDRLIAAGADINKQDDSGMSPLEFACLQGNDLVVDKLIIAGADIHSFNRLDRNPLGYACMGNRDLVVDRLITAGAKPYEKGPNGKSPLDYALDFGHLKLVKRLQAMQTFGNKFTAISDV